MQAESAPVQARALDRTIRILTLALALAVVGFAAYYYVDRRPAPGPTLVDRAVEQAEQAVRGDPASADARIALGDLYLQKARYAEAVAQYSAALQIDDDLWTAHRGLGLAYLGQGQLAQADRELQWVVDAKRGGQYAPVDKDLEEAYFYQARILIGLNQPDRAVEALEAALKIDRTDADAWQQLGAIYLSTGKPEEAAKALRKAVLFVPRFPEAYESLARAYTALGDEPGARYARAMAHYSAGAYDEAIKQLQALTAEKPDLADAWTGLGLAFEAKLQKREAAAAYHRALQGNPDDFGAAAGLTRLGTANP